MSLLLLGANQFNVEQDLFSNNEQGLWLDPSDMTAGKAAWRRNLLTYSEMFSHANWTKQGSLSVTPNTDIGVDGLLTADTLTNTGVSNAAAYQVVSMEAGVYTFRVWVKAGTATQVTLKAWRSGPGLFASTTVSGLTSEYQEVTLTINNAAAGSVLVYIYPNSSAATSGSIVVARAMLVAGSTIETYQPITDFSTEFQAAFPTHTLYQDSNGVTPCTAAGDPVGLILDQSRGGLGALGSELVTNGDFSSGQTGWIDSPVAPSGWSFTGGALVGSNAAGGYEQAVQVTSGKWYRCTITLSNVSGGAVSFAISGAGAGPTFNSNGTNTVLINAGSTGNIGIVRRTSNFTGTIDNISIREVPGNHAYQTTSASRPTLARIPVSGRRNLLTYSEDISNAVWGKTVATITGTDTIVLSAGSASKFIAYTITGTAPSTISFEAKAGTHRYIQVLSSSDSQHFVNIDLTDGVIGTTGTKAEGSAVQDLGDGWRRYRVTLTTTGFSAIRFYAADSTSSVYGTSTNSTGSWQLRKIQLETGSTATNYQKVVATTDVTESGVSDLWHLSFDGSDDSLVTNSISFDTWTQETRRNLLVATEDFSNSTWIKTNLGVSGNTMTPDATLGQHRIFQQVTHTSPHVFSVEAKANGYNFISLAYAGGLSGQSIFFDLSNGTISGSLANFTPTITAVGDGWYRCSLAYNISIASTAINHFIFIRNAASIANYSGDGVSGVLLRYPQLEEGSTLTTYQRVGTAQMTVIAGVRKLSDATGIVVENSATSDTNNGSFVFLTTTTGYGMRLRGSNLVTTTQDTYNAPRNDVLSCVYDTAQLTIATQINSRINSAFVQAGAGTTTNVNFGNYSIYIGRRGGASFSFNGHIYQLIIRGRTTPTGKLLEAERFTARKTGLSI